MAQGIQEATVAQKAKPHRAWKGVELDPNLWTQMKSAAVLRGMTITEAIEQAIAGWLERN